MRVAHAAVLIVLLARGVSAAAQRPAAPNPGTSPAAAGQPIAPLSSGRGFTGAVGLLFNAVRPDRVPDFEKLIGHLRTALSASQDLTVRAQAKGWRVFKAGEPGPNGSVLYVFVIDPVVPGADYGLGRILADAYPDPAELQGVWKLYTDSVASGGSLLNLTPVKD